MELVFYDVETTGLNVWKDKLTEVAAISGNSMGFTVLLQIGEPLSDFIVKFTGITDQLLLEDGVDPRLALQRFYEYLQAFKKPVILIAHNGDQFDKLILHSSFRRLLGENTPFLQDCDIHHFDTRLMAKFLYPNLKSYSLKNLCTHFHIENPNHHRALNDAIVCKKLFEHMFQESPYTEFRILYRDIYGKNF